MTVIARWESKSKKHWVDLEKDQWGFAYSSPGSGGSLGRISKDEALLEMERRVNMGLFQPDKNKTPMVRVK
jgi:hypothetical protein